MRGKFRIERIWAWLDEGMREKDKLFLAEIRYIINENVFELMSGE